MFKFRIFLSGILLGIICISGMNAFAIDESAVHEVQRVIPNGYEPLGMRLGTLIVDPALKVDQKYDDNIYRRKDGRVSDNITVSAPSVDIRTDWNLHELKAGAKAALGRYQENSQENYDDYSYYLSGRYDIDYGTFLNFSARSEYRHEDRGSLDDVNGDTPIEYRADSYDIGFTRELGILKLYVKAGGADYSYDNSTQNAVVIDHGDRNYRADYYKALLVYGLTDNFDVYMQGQYDRQYYGRRSTTYRNSFGREYRLGVKANVTGGIKIGAFAGFSDRRYAQQGGMSEAAIYGGSLLWNIDELTSVNTVFSRSLDSVSLTNVAGVLRTRASMDVQHALMDNLFIGASAWYQGDVYDEYGLAADRDNKTYGTGIGVEYMLSRSVRVGGDYDFVRREYETVGQGYKNHEASVFLKVAY